MQNKTATSNSNQPNAATPESQPMTTVTKHSISKRNIKLVGVAIIASLVVLIVVSEISYNLGKKSVKSTNSQQTDPEETEFIDFVAKGLTPAPRPTKTDIEEGEEEGNVSTTTKIVLGTKELDGYMASDGVGDNTQDIRAGRNTDAVTRGFTNFDLSSIPTGVSIKAAELRLYQNKTVGTPYTASGELRFDHLNYGDSLDDSDYSLPAFTSNYGILSTSKRLGWKEVDVTDAVRDDFANGRTQSQYRVHFGRETTGGDIKGDIVYFVSSNTSSSTNRPQLVIEYY